MKVRKSPCLTVALVVLLMAKGGAAFAHSEAQALVDQQHCMFCHTAEPPYLAPSFQQIANHYRNVPNARSALERKLSPEGPTHWAA